MTSRTIGVKSLSGSQMEILNPKWEIPLNLFNPPLQDAVCLWIHFLYMLIYIYFTKKKIYIYIKEDLSISSWWRLPYPIYLYTFCLYPYLWLHVLFPLIFNCLWCISLTLCTWNPLNWNWVCSAWSFMQKRAVSPYPYLLLVTEGRSTEAAASQIRAIMWSASGTVGRPLFEWLPT